MARFNGIAQVLQLSPEVLDDNLYRRFIARLFQISLARDRGNLRFQIELRELASNRFHIQKVLGNDR